MTPKEKAEELVNKYFLEVESADTYDFNLPSMCLFIAKKCALIAVDEILKTLPQSEYLEDRLEMVENRELIYWKEVKQEIEKL